MADNVCQVSIANQNYWIPCDRVQDLAYLDGFLVNMSASSLTLRIRYSDETVYPYISCNAFSTCNKRTSQQVGNVPVTDAAIFTGDLFKTVNYDYFIFITLLLLLGVRLLWKR